MGILFASLLRPGSVQVRINGKEKNITADVEKGYLILKRVWENDEVELVFPMKIRKIYANLKVREDAGCVAFMRGPIVYCFEGVDNPMQRWKRKSAKKACWKAASCLRSKHVSWKQWEILCTVILHR